MLCKPKFVILQICLCWTRWNGHLKRYVFFVSSPGGWGGSHCTKEFIVADESGFDLLFGPSGFVSFRFALLVVCQILWSREVYSGCTLTGLVCADGKDDLLAPQAVGMEGRAGVLTCNFTWVVEQL